VELEFTTEFGNQLSFACWLLRLFAMGKSPPTSPSKLLAAWLLIAKSTARKKKAKKGSAAVKSPAGRAKGKSTVKENEPPAAAGKKGRSIVIMYVTYFVSNALNGAFLGGQQR
jgi:hypothetical protein